jgi:hypothetical protein
MYERETLRFGSKLFRWTLIPTQAGTRDIPAIAFSYFNPQSLSYETRFSQPINLTIAPEDSHGTAADNESAALPTVNIDAPALKPIEQQAPYGLPKLPDMRLFAMLWLIAPAIAALAAISRRPTTATDKPSRSRRRLVSRPLAHARRQLQDSQSREPVAAYQHIHEAMLTYLSSKAGREITAQTASEAVTHLPPKLRRYLIDALTESGGGQYAPISEKDAHLLAKRVEKILSATDARWSARS